MKTVFEKPTKAEQKFAKGTLTEWIRSSENKKSTHRVFISFQGKEHNSSREMPAYVIRYLKFLLKNMAEGKALMVSPMETELSTQETADMLGVSRPFVVKLLEQNKIPFKKVGSHRRIELKHLHAYEQKQIALRDKKLGFLSKQAQELNLGYDL